MDILKYARRRKDGVGSRILVACLIILMFIIFLIGMHIGRIVEKSAKMESAQRVVAKPGEREEVGKSIQEKMSQFEAGRERKVSRTLPPVTATVPPSAPRTKPRSVSYYLQVGVFSVESNAKRFAKKAEMEGFPVTLESMKDRKGKVLTKVLIGPYPTEREMERVKPKVAVKLGVKRPIPVKK